MAEVASERTAVEDVSAWAGVGDSATVPIDFRYGDRLFSETVGLWDRTDQDVSTEGTEPARRTTFVQRGGGLVVEIDTLRLPGHTAVDWVARVRNDGVGKSPVLSDVFAASLAMARDGHPLILRRSKGSAAQRRDFEPVPYEPTNWQDREPSPFWTTGEPIRERQEIHFGSVGGRSSNGHLPFFDLETGDRGVTIAIGWSGQWAVGIDVPDTQTFHVRAGMPNCRLSLEPGEEIRTPRVLLHAWRGSRTDAHNEFRRIMLQRYTPRVDDEPVVVPIAASSFAFFPEVTLDTPMATMGTGVTEDNQIRLLDAYVDKNIPIEVFWIDAGWYDNPGTWRHGVGNWYPNPRTFPNGLRPIADAVHAAGKRLLVWFEPERVVAGTEIHRDHPEWLLRVPADDGNLLFNLGNDEARAWLIERISGLIGSEGIDLLRHDFNIDPLPYWEQADTPDRRGMTEIRYVEGLYQFWDALRERHPALIIDNCASGGRRIDIETISRAIALTRSDYPFLKIAEPDGSDFERYEPTGLQAHTWAINHYLPVSGTSTNRTDPYGYRSALTAGMHIAWDPRRDDFPAHEARSRLREHVEIRHFFHGDYYPLTPYSVDRGTWMGYQFHRSDLDAGVVLLFRRSESCYETATFVLPPIERFREYEVTDVATQKVSTMAGDELMRLTITIAERRDSVVIRYRSLPSQPSDSSAASVTSPTQR